MLLVTNFNSKAWWDRDRKNKGELVGQKAPLRLKEIWAIRIRLQLAQRTRELALLNLEVDSKLRSGDFVTMRVRDITHGERIAARKSLCSNRLNARYSSKSPSSREIPSPHGSASRATIRPLL
jgi:hypothetical protein